ncbi:MAG TPA: hypothetical protein VKQ30_16340 [Ktedonobacterales bacterium]|nr:hypothetical protein [Ktedonobacterales bacterium]
MGAGGSQQVHDFNPGEENGLFWTIPLVDDDLDLDVHNGGASLVLRDLGFDDYGNVGNALSGGHEIATAKLSVRIVWRGITRRISFADAALPTPFAVRAAFTGAAMEWSAVEGGETITGSRSATPDFAMLGRERNGLFFSDST